MEMWTMAVAEQVILPPKILWRSRPVGAMPIDKTIHTLESLDFYHVFLSIPMGGIPLQVSIWGGEA